jgi:hypothetical protein
MIFNRRLFLSLFFMRPARTTSIQVTVIETFDSRDITSAVLVHHADEPSRDLFARWLQANSRTEIRVRKNIGTEVPARIFRVRMCFGRGLILFDRPIRIAEREILTLQTVD